MKKLLVIIVLLMGVFALSACEGEASTASENLSKDADNFKILRKVIFYNSITGEYMYAIEGFCSIYADVSDSQLEVTCEVGNQKYEKHFLGLSDNVAYMVLQLEPANVSAYHNKIYLRPEVLIPDIEILTEE